MLLHSNDRRRERESNGLSEKKKKKADGGQKINGKKWNVGTILATHTKKNSFYMYTHTERVRDS